MSLLGCGQLLYTYDALQDLSCRTLLCEHAG